MSSSKKAGKVITATALNQPQGTEAIEAEIPELPAPGSAEDLLAANRAKRRSGGRASTVLTKVAGPKRESRPEQSIQDVLAGSIPIDGAAPRPVLTAFDSDFLSQRLNAGRSPRRYSF